MVIVIVIIIYLFLCKTHYTVWQIILQRSTIERRYTNIYIYIYIYSYIYSRAFVPKSILARNSNNSRSRWNLILDIKEPLSEYLYYISDGNSIIVIFILKFMVFTENLKIEFTTLQYQFIRIATTCINYNALGSAHESRTYTNDISSTKITHIFSLYILE